MTSRPQQFAGSEPFTLSCLVKTCTKAKTIRDDDYWAITILRDGMQYPEQLSCFDLSQLDEGQLQPNTRHNLIVQRGKLKKDKPDDGQRASYFWDVLGEGAEPEPSTAPPPQHIEPVRQTEYSDHARGEQNRGDLNMREYETPYEDPTRTSIEHQVCMKEARLATDFLLSAGATDIDTYLITLNRVYRGLVKTMAGAAYSDTRDADNDRAVI
jgi:hypothetical protein